MSGSVLRKGKRTREAEEKKQARKRCSSYNHLIFSLSFFSTLSNRRVASHLDGLEYAKHVQQQAQETRRRHALAAAAAAAAEQHESSSSSSDDDDNDAENESGGSKKKKKKNKKRRRTRRRPDGDEGSGYGDSVSSSLGALVPSIEVERAWQEIEGRGSTAATMTPLDPRRIP